MKKLGMLACLVMMACGGSGNNETGSEATACVSSSGGMTVSCTEEKNIDSAGKSAIDNSCSSGGLTVASSCPSANLLGCCKVTNSSNIASYSCYYQGDAATYKSACENNGDGTWSTSAP